MSFQAIPMEVSKKVKDAKGNGVFQKVGEVTIFTPLLKDILPFVGSEIKKDDKGNPVMEEGIPVYESDEANWFQGAILASVKAQARNKLKTGTAELKDNNKIATDWAELIAEGVRDGAGLKIARECKEAFAAWVATQGLSENAANTVITLFSNKPALAVQTKGMKDKVKARIMSFGDSLTDEQMEKFSRPINSVLEACEGDDADDNF